MQQRNYSLWLEPPEGLLRAALAREIAAQTARGAARGYAAPAFAPHVTLLPDIPATDEDSAIEGARKLAAALAPVRADFLDVATGGTFHQCVFLKCALTPALAAANAAARAAFGKPTAAEEERPYMPHLSLLYADIGDETRAAAAADAVARLYGPAADHGTLLPAAGFTAAALTVWETAVEDRALATWRRVAELPLGG